MTSILNKIMEYLSIKEMLSPENQEQHERWFSGRNDDRLSVFLPSWM